MKKTTIIDILTTLIPEKKKDKLLEDKNPILKVENRECFKLNIFNKKSEIPKDSRYIKLLSKEYQSKKRERPLLSDYYNDSLSDWIIISNSDIVFFCNIEEIIQQCEQNKIGFATSRRFDTENIDLFFKNQINFSNMQEYLNKHCKFQSKRTLDFFLINKYIFKSLLTRNNNNLKTLSPGTVLFDIYLYLSARSLTKTADITSGCLIIHQNHEEFRISSKLNLLTSNKEKNDFVLKRKTYIKKDILYGCLTSSDFYLSNQIMIKKSQYRAKIRYKMESLRIKFINKIEMIIYYWNYYNFQINRLILKKNQFTLKRIFGLLILIPSININEKNEDTNFESFKEYLREKYNSYTKKIIKKYF